jgi:hypothetical protein
MATESGRALEQRTTPAPRVGCLGCSGWPVCSREDARRACLVTSSSSSAPRLEEATISKHGSQGFLMTCPRRWASSCIACPRAPVVCGDPDAGGVVAGDPSGPGGRAQARAPHLSAASGFSPTGRAGRCSDHKEAGGDLVRPVKVLFRSTGFAYGPGAIGVILIGGRLYRAPISSPSS